MIHVRRRDRDIIVVADLADDHEGRVDAVGEVGSGVAHLLKLLVRPFVHDDGHGRVAGAALGIHPEPVGAAEEFPAVLGCQLDVIGAAGRGG